MIQQDKFLEIIQIYKKIIEAWKKRSDVISGFDLSWRPNKSHEVKLENRPYTFGDGTGTTGWCVSASQSLLEDAAFQTNLNLRNAKAKLISIDLREQYYGNCFNGSQNMWHTAIFVEDSGVEFVIDITCRQFGNNFIEKDFWDFVSWQETLRSPLCKHNITDFKNNSKDYIPVINENIPIYNKESYKNDIFRDLHKITNIDDNDRNMLSEFFVNKINTFNNKLLSNNLSLEDVNYVEQLNKKLQYFPFNTYQKTYSILEFNSKNSLKNWIEDLLNNDGKLNMFLLTSKSLESAKFQNNIDLSNLNIKNSVEENKHYLIFEFNNQFGIDTYDFLPKASLLLPFNIQLDIVNVFNGALINEYNYGVMNNEDVNEKIEKLSEELNENNKTNTIWIICN